MPLKLNRDDQTSINLTPMIDIVFLLIIFFMIGTRFSELNESERTYSAEFTKGRQRQSPDDGSKETRHQRG